MAAGMHDMTQGPLRGHIVRIAAFIAFSMVVSILYGLVDLYWVGHLGSQAIAAVGVGSNLNFVVLAGTQALSIGTVALVAQAAGRKDMAAVTAATAQATSLAIAGALGYLVLGYACMHAYANHIAADATTAQLTVEYLVWFIPALCLQMLMAAQGSALRGLGNMKLATVTQMGSIALNFVLAPVLVLGKPFGVALGVGGAGLATFISVLVAAAYLSWTLARTEGPLRFPLAALKPELQAWKRIVTIGLPAAAEFLLMATYLFTVYFLTKPFGSDIQAGFGIGMRWLQACFMPALAISFATAAVVGQNFGAGRLDRVRASFGESLRLSGLLLAGPGLLLLLAPEWLMSLLTPEPGVIRAGADFLHVIAWNLVASALIFACSGLFQGMGTTLPSLISSAVRIVLLLAIVVGLSRRAGFHPGQIYVASVATTALQAGLAFLLLRRELRLRLRDASPEAAPAAAAQDFAALQRKPL